MCEHTRYGTPLTITIPVPPTPSVCYCPYVLGDAESATDEFLFAVLGATAFNIPSPKRHEQRQDQGDEVEHSRLFGSTRPEPCRKRYRQRHSQRLDEQMQWKTAGRAIGGGNDYIDQKRGEKAEPIVADRTGVAHTSLDFDPERNPPQSCGGGMDKGRIVSDRIHRRSSRGDREDGP